MNAIRWRWALTRHSSTEALNEAEEAGQREGEEDSAGGLSAWPFPSEEGRRKRARWKHQLGFCLPTAPEKVNGLYIDTAGFVIENPIHSLIALAGAVIELLTSWGSGYSSSSAVVAVGRIESTRGLPLANDNQAFQGTTIE